MYFSYEALVLSTLLHLDHLLWTTGGDSSITLTDEFLSSSRRQRTNALRAALDAEYAESPVAGTIAMLDPVLTKSEKLISRIHKTPYYIRLVSDFLSIRNGRNFMVISTKAVKFTEMSEWKTPRSTLSG